MYKDIFKHVEFSKCRYNVTLLNNSSCQTKHCVYCVSSSRFTSTDTSDRRYLDQCDTRKGDSLQAKKRHTSKTFGLESTEHAVIFLQAQKHQIHRSQSSRTMCGTGSLCYPRDEPALVLRDADICAYATLSVWKTLRGFSISVRQLPEAQTDRSRSV